MHTVIFFNSFFRIFYTWWAFMFLDYRREYSLQTTGYADSLRANCQRNLYDTYYCCVYSGKLLTIDRGIVRNM